MKEIKSNKVLEKKTRIYQINRLEELNDFYQKHKRECKNMNEFLVNLMFGGLRIGEALTLKWENVNFENKTLKVECVITQIPKFDNDGKVISRVTVIADTKTACSVREISIADIVVETLQRWREKQIEQNTNPDVTADLTAKNAFIFANDDGNVRTYFGSRKIFDGWKKRHKLTNYNIHFHVLRHTFSNMLFEMNENPKVIQQLLGHRDVKNHNYYLQLGK